MLCARQILFVVKVMPKNKGCVSTKSMTWHQNYHHPLSLKPSSQISLVIRIASCHHNSSLPNILRSTNSKAGFAGPCVPIMLRN